ncbi:MAG: zinc ribbon domain-containing protein [Porcipelethomonas sp.]
MNSLKEEKIIKNIWQYSQKLDNETMLFLRGIACDYNKVKNYALARYSGIRSINKLVPGYEILNEMRASGMRQQLNLPAVYFEMALFEAIWSIKAMWQNIRSRIVSLANQSDNLSDDEKSYIRIVMKINSVYSAILSSQEFEMPRKAQKLNIDADALNNRIRRWTRRYKAYPKSGKSNTFRVTPAGFSYKDGGIRLVSRTERKRVFIPLKDAVPCKRQLNIVIMEDSIKIAVPTEAKVVYHADYENTVFAHIGYKDMITLSDGSIYGRNLSDYVFPETERLRTKNKERHKIYSVYSENLKSGNSQKALRIEKNNLGRVKYNAQKARKNSETKIFINTELNRLLKTEKPCRIVITEPARHGKMNRMSKQMKNMLTRSYYRYIYERIAYKCRLNGIELVQINSKGTADTCSRCGEKGIRKHLEFRCEKCGLEISSALNSAKNIEKNYIRREQ